MKKKKESTQRKKKIDIGFEIFLLRTKAFILFVEVRNRFRRFIYCRRGYHRLVPNSLKVQTNFLDDITRKRVSKCLIDASWLECPYCKTLFFDNDDERRKYDRYQDMKKKQRERMFDLAMKEALKSRG